MAIIKKYGETLTQNLSSFATFVKDTNPNSTYFKITEFNDTFTGGKNGFLIEGSEYLKESTEIKIQILDVNGDPIYYEPGNGIPEYYEGTSKVIAVYIYEDTPIGVGKITILGELKSYLDEGNVVRDIPDEWKDVYNVKWEKEFKINRLLSNEDKVRFYRRPKVSINEIVKPIFNNVTTTIIQTGSLSGIAQSPQVGQPLLNYTAPTSYILSIDDNTNWTGSVVGTYIEVPSLNYRTLADSVINRKTLLVNTPYTNTSLGSIAPVENFSNEGYTASFNYVEGVNNLKTALTGSFAKITLSDLTTFVGDCARVKIFRKSQSDLADYQFIQEIRLESNEILRDLESQTKNEEFYGIFDNTNYKNYWVTSSNNLVTTFDQNYLFNSIKLDSTGVNSFFTTSSLSISENIEYTLNLNVRVASGQVSADKYIRAFLSGSKQSTLNGNPITVQVEQDIVTITSDNSLLQKNQVTANFKAEQSENTKLYFEVKGTGWYLADVGLRASQETAYSPDEITFIQSVPRTLPEETFLYRFEFYDINNNYIPVLVEASKTFDGGNLQRIQKGLVFTPRSLQFQFDSGSNPVPPTVVGFTVTKNLLTGSVTYTSQSFDFDGNELFAGDYAAYITNGGGFPGLLDGITSDAPTMTVQHFTGSRTDKTIQLVKITGEVEGFTDTVIFSRVLDGFGGVNHLIRPYRGTQIRNSSTSSLEIQAIRIDGVNDIEISSTTKPEKGWPDKQLHVLSASLNPLTEPEKFINLALASSSGYVRGLTTGSLGSGEINYNATFNRDSIDTRRTIYLMSSGSAASGPAYITSASVLASIILEDLQDGLDTPVVKFNTDTFNIDPRNESLFRPTFTFGTASFYKRGTIEEITASFQVFPSMSINEDWVPEYWLYYTTQSVDSTISVRAIDEARRVVPSRAVSAFTGLSTEQSKNLTITFTYTEPYTSASISIDKTFTIVPQGNPGDETIVFEITPANVTLAANSRGIVNDYKPSITEIKVKQGSRYLAFTGSVSKDKFASHGTFHIAQTSITASNITGGLVYFDNNYTSSLIVSQSSGFVNLSGSITYPLIIHPYYTSSIYTASVVQQYTKVLDGPPPIQITINPLSANITADEVGFVSASNYAAAFTNITVREGDDFLTFTTQSNAAGTWRINKIETSGSVGVWNIRTGSLASSSFSTATLDFNRFDFPFVSASALYEIEVYPYALGPGHEYTSSIYFRNQSFTKNVSPLKARSVNLSATSTTVNFNGDGVQVSPEGSIFLNATPIGVTGSAFYQFYKDGIAYSAISQDPQFEIPSGDATGPGQIAVWKVELRDGNSNSPVRAASEVTISGIKAGQDAFQSFVANQNASIAASLWDTSFSGSGAIVNASKQGVPLEHTTTYVGLPISYEIDGVTPIGVLGYYSASIFSKSDFISINSQSRLLGNPASINDLTFWYKPAVNSSAQIVYKVDFEDGRATHYHTQSFSVNFTPPAPYDVKLQTDASNITYRVSGEIELANSGNIIRAYRGGQELTNVNTFTNPTVDAYGVVGYPNQCRVSIYSKSSYLNLGGGLTAGSWVSGTPSTMPAVAGWDFPDNNIQGEIVFQIDCEGRQTLYKTQSLALTFEGATGPGIVMRGVWSNAIDYIGSVETTNSRRDAVIWPDPATYNNETHFWAAISGSGPATYDGASVLVGAQQPDSSAPWVDSAYWQYLGQEEFFVAAKIAIFEESYVKNTINVGTKNGTGAFANIVIAGGRTDPYIAIGQNATVGTSGGSGTTLNPGGSVIGYDRPGIFLGIYEQGASGTTGRFSIKDTSGTRYLKWDGTDLGMSGKLNAGGMELGTGVNASSGNGLYLNSNNYWFDTGTSFKVGGATNYIEWNGTNLTLRGTLRQLSNGDPEGTFRGAWAASTSYYVGDTVTYSGSTYICLAAHLSTNNTNINTGFPPNATNSWAISAASGTSGTGGSSGTAGTGGTSGNTAKLLRVESTALVFVEAQDGTLSPTFIELTSTKQNITSTTNWTTSPSVTLYDAATGGSATTTGNIVYLRRADFGTNTAVQITATADSISDRVTIARVQEGTDALTVVLTNESHTLPAANDGTVSSYSNSGTDIYIYEGATQLDYDGVGTSAGKWTLSSSPTNITVGSVTDGGNYAVIGNHSNMTADQASISYTLTGKKLNGDSFSLTKVQSFAKSRAGATGAAGDPGPGVVFRGNYNAATAYFHLTGVGARRDVVRYPANTGTYYLTNNTAKNGLTTWGTPGVADWEPFGAQFSSVATDILLAQDATITRGLVMGVEGVNSGFIRSANATSLTTGSLPGFYMQTDGQFRLGHNPEDVHFPAGSKPPYLKWDNTTLTIRGKIETDQNTTSQIGNWKVEDGAFKNDTEEISLDALTKQIIITDTSNIPRVFIKQANISNPTAGTTTLAINPPATYNFGAGVTFSTAGSVDFNEYTFDTVGFSVTTPGTYTISSVNWGSGYGIHGDANLSFTGFIEAYLNFSIYTTPDLTGTYIGGAYLGGFLTGLNSAGDEDDTVYQNGYTWSVTFPSAGTYYIHTFTAIYGYIAGGSVTISGVEDPASNNATLQQAQTELGQDGFLVIADSDNYVKIKRTTTEPIIEIETDKAYPALRITNTNASGRAIEVLDGDIFSSGTGNNIRVAGGWIGGNATTNSVRIGEQGGWARIGVQNLYKQNLTGRNQIRITGNASILGLNGGELYEETSTIANKIEIEDYPETAYDSIKKLKPILFTPRNNGTGSYWDPGTDFSYEEEWPYIENPKEYIGKQAGFIAEWVDEIPEMRRFVAYAPSGSAARPKGLAYDKLVVPLTKAVQILMAKVESLEAQLSGSLNL